MKPFVILALPRCGTRMVTRSLSDVFGPITHEFRGTEDEYWEHPYVLSNFVRPWMMSDDIQRIHLWREDYITAAKTLLLMFYMFPDGVQDMRTDYLIKTARDRKADDQRFRDASDWSISYEELTGGKEIDQLPQSFVDRFCATIGVDPQPVPVVQRKDWHPILKNEDEIRCLRV